MQLKSSNQEHFQYASAQSDHSSTRLLFPTELHYFFLAVYEHLSPSLRQIGLGSVDQLETDWVLQLERSL